MERLEQREHDYSAVVRQASVIGRLRDYITWQRGLRRSTDDVPFPLHGPLTVHLDITTACNFSCPHCVDSRLLNSGEYLDMETIRRSIDTLMRHGLRSVVLSGGGEPTIHKNFEEIVLFSKECGLQLGIVTNGSHLDKVSAVAELLREGDWLQVSLDAGRESTFFKTHRPRGRVSLEGVLEGVRTIKSLNPRVQAGCSHMIVWEGVVVNGHELCPTVGEMVQVVKNAREYALDHVTFRPCLLRVESSKKESIFEVPDPSREARIIEEITSNLRDAQATASGRVRIFRSVSLDAMLDHKVHELKVQPKVCHSQFFRTLLAPSGIFHCPGLRGEEHARIGDAAGYRGRANFDFTRARLEHSIRTFDAGLECGMVACACHYLNQWIETVIRSGDDVAEIPSVPDDHSFLPGMPE